jgi:hypothetical protein
LVDLLHGWLRSSDKLENLLYQAIQHLDKLNKGWADDTKMDNKPNLIKFIRYLESIGIKKSYNLHGGKIRFRQFTGLEKLKIFKHVNLVSLYPEMKNVEKIQSLWTRLFRIFDTLKHGNYENKETMASEIKDSTSEWLEDFLEIYHEDHVTPYIHVLVEHVHEMVAMYGDLSLFTTEGKLFLNKISKTFSFYFQVSCVLGLEKLNDLTTKLYFQSTNKHSDFLKQILNKRNRMEKMRVDELVGEDQLESEDEEFEN